MNLSYHRFDSSFPSLVRCLSQGLMSVTPIPSRILQDSFGNKKTRAGAEYVSTAAGSLVDLTFHLPLAQCSVTLIVYHLSAFVKPYDELACHSHPKPSIGARKRLNRSDLERCSA